MKKSFDAYVTMAVNLGAREAKIIETASIVTAPWVRRKCQFGCGMHGASLCCPPKTPDHRETREIICCYRRALLVHCGWKVRPAKIVWRLEREIFLAGHYKALGFGSGPCSFCRDCNNESCLHPEKARPSMEACGIDVFATVRKNGYPIEVLGDTSCEVNMYGLVLIG